MGLSMGCQTVRISKGDNAVPEGEHLRGHAENVFRVGLGMRGADVKLSYGK